jgi:hypothetical protein
MKRASILFVLLLCSTVYGADVPYTFTTVDISVPGHPNKVAYPDDINESGDVVSTAVLTYPNNLVIIGNPMNPRKSKFKADVVPPTTFNCGDTWGSSINGSMRVTGYCTGGAFVRHPNGTVTMLTALGESAIGFNMSSDGWSTGQYCTPNGPPDFGCTLHGYSWRGDVGYQLIDFPGNIHGPGIKTRSMLIARNKNGKILGFYTTSLVDNTVLEDGYFIYDNGFFDTTTFSDPAIFLTDYNDDDQTIVYKNGHLQLYDDGNLYDIVLPAGWILQDLGGINNLSPPQFVGIYSIAGTGQAHGFIATPAGMGSDKRSAKADKQR